MCGLAGFINGSNQPCDIENTLKHMISTLNHRGPDDTGIWVDKNNRIGIGHKRLSILDLSEEGKQPMISESGRYLIAYNGEIYNHIELSKRLNKIGIKFRGHSDTEVILASFEVWGFKQSLSSFIGMFAFALWDRIENKLYLVRDRLGIKPMYYGYVNGSFVFASELKAFLVFPKFQAIISREAIALYLRHNYIPAPYSIYQNIHKLSPGCILELDTIHTKRSDYKICPYWSAVDITERGVNNQFLGSENEAVEHLDTLLRDAVKLRMVADVPIGAFLSGGIDSSLVTALMQSQSNLPIKTFSIGFYEKAYNEANHAKAVAQFLGTEHTELYVRPEETMAVIPKLPTIFDEPFSDSSQIPTFLVSNLAHSHVKVSLSGDGGDELFYGYSRYSFTQDLWQKLNLLPKRIKVVSNRISKIAANLGSQKMQALYEILSMGNSDDLYRRTISHWKNPANIVLNSIEPPTIFGNSNQCPRFQELAQRMMYFDLVTYLPDNILVKLDRASMGVSLEARVPILDHRVVEFAWRLPLSHKIKGKQGKWILRQLLYKYVPKELVERPKKGFGIPIGTWLRGPLRDWAESLLNENRLRQEGYFDHVPIRQKWREHLAGKEYRHYYLWDILMFQSWLDSNRH